MKESLKSVNRNQK